MRNLLEDFNAKVKVDGFLKQAIGNQSLHEISNDGVPVVNSETSKHLTVKRKTFPFRNIHKFTCTSLDSKTQRWTTEVYLMANRSSQQFMILATMWWWQELGRD
jgi:hypothetical protein